MIIRTETPANHSDIHHLIRQALGQEDEIRLVRRIRDGENYIPELSLVAEEDGIIKGHILFSKIKIKGTRDFPSLALAPVAVMPEYHLLTLRHPNGNIRRQPPL